MKQTTAASQSESARETEPVAAPPSELNTTKLLIGLMVPMGMTVLNLSMFGVALPEIRDAFQVQPDQVAWLVTAYTLPFMMFMPFYGRMADGLGKRRLFMLGIIVFFIGTFICMMAVEIPMLLVGRVIQGVGTAGVNPLCIAIISDLFPFQERGRALGTWSSTGPATSMIGPVLGGFLIDHWGWRSIFVPDLLAALIALYVVYIQLPVMRGKFREGFLRAFDWIGMVLLGAAITLFMFYMSSRAITGREPLRDWRLLGLGMIALAGFVWWERRHASPLVSFGIFRRRNFGLASLCASLRMFIMSGVSFLIPLYVADLYNLNASALGGLITLHAAALLTTVRLGGRFADSPHSRYFVVFGLTAQAGTMLYFAFLPASTSVILAGVGLVGHGAAAGLSLAVLHRAAMGGVPQDESGAAAGLYSMVRFGGNIVGATLGGVVLQQALIRSPSLLAAYQQAFLFIAAVGVLGAVAALRLKN